MPYEAYEQNSKVVIALAAELLDDFVGFLLVIGVVQQINETGLLPIKVL